jgi:hypothetical protein
MAFTSQDGPSTDESAVRDRIEFVAVDIGGGPDSTDDNEGFLRRYTARTGMETALRGEWPSNGSNPPTPGQVKFCGDWHRMVPHNNQWTGANADTSLKFYPASVHATTWFRAQMESLYVARPALRPNTASSANANARADSAQTTGQIMANSNARCFLPGDPHLVAVDRPTASYALPEIRKGGDDTTFTASGNYGAWKAYTGTAIAALSGRADKGYLFPLHRSFNPNFKGVIYESGNVGVSGVLNGHVTLYAKGTIVILDDVRYANDPSKNIPCASHDILGMLTDKEVVVADNAINSPPYIAKSGGNQVYLNADDTKDLYIHGVIMAMGTSFRVENYAGGPTNANDCDVTNNGRGCIYLAGGIIQNSRGPVVTSGGTGIAKRYS